MSARADGAASSRVTASAVFLAAVAVLELAARISGLRIIQDLTWVAMAGVVATNLRRLGVREFYLLGLSVLLFLINFFISLRWGQAAGDNPWQAWTLEWATSSPPPAG